MKTVKFSVGLKTHVLSAVAVSSFHIKRVSDICQGYWILTSFTLFPDNIEQWGCNICITVIGDFVYYPAFSEMEILAWENENSAYVWVFLEMYKLEPFCLQRFCLIFPRGFSVSAWCAPIPACFLSRKKGSGDDTSAGNTCAVWGYTSSKPLSWQYLWKDSDTGIPAETQAIENHFLICL